MQRRNHSLQQPRWIAVMAAFVMAIHSAVAVQPAVAREPIEAADVILSISEEVEVSAAAAGVIVELTAREGTLIEAGELLLRVDDRRAKLAMDQATVELRMAAEEAKSDVRQRHALKSQELAQSEHRRAVEIDLASPGSVSDREIDRLRMSADVAELEVERAEHESRMAGLQWKLAQHAYHLAKAETDDHQVAAPIAGLVVEVHKRPGEWVDRGDPVVTLVRVDRLRAEGFLPVATATLDLTGAAAVFRTTLADGDIVEARGKVSFVSPKADPVSALAQIWIDLPATDRRLRPGLRGNVQIVPQAATRASKQSASAVRTVSHGEPTVKSKQGDEPTD